MAENKLCNKGAWQSIRQIYIRFLFLEYLLWIIYVMYAIRGMHMNISIRDRFSMRYLDLSILPLKYHPRLPRLATCGGYKYRQIYICTYNKFYPE